MFYLKTNIFVSPLERIVPGTRVFTEVTFWNSAEYGILLGSDITSAEFRGIFHCLIPRNLTFTDVFLKNLKLQRQNFANFRGSKGNSATRNYVYFRGIFANSVPHTECTEVKKRRGFPC
jgi:hypothetical protein